MRPCPVPCARCSCSLWRPRHEALRSSRQTPVLLCRAACPAFFSLHAGARPADRSSKLQPWRVLAPSSLLAGSPCRAPLRAELSAAAFLSPSSSSRAVQLLLPPPGVLPVPCALPISQFQLPHAQLLLLPSRPGSCSAIASSSLSSARGLLQSVARPACPVCTPRSLVVAFCFLVARSVLLFLRVLPRSSLFSSPPSRYRARETARSQYQVRDAHVGHGKTLCVLVSELALVMAFGTVPCFFSTHVLLLAVATAVKSSESFNLPITSWSVVDFLFVMVQHCY
uniref:Uncharacterized protein n=1 Tax=Zea mays TaxID=4577 RepID=B6UAC0_MAIZE|nr:hypothetical protein [Zea mays]